MVIYFIIFFCEKQNFYANISIKDVIGLGGLRVGSSQIFILKVHYEAVGLKIFDPISSLISITLSLHNFVNCTAFVFILLFFVAFSC